MNAKDFFLNSVKDNNYIGYNLKGINLDCDFIEDTNGRWNKNREQIRREDISSYLRELDLKFANKNLSELNISLISFDEEFEANQDQKLFDLSGYDFDNFKIYTGNIVGSIVYKSVNFNINCRFGNHFLQYMVANTSGFLELENFGAIDKNVGIGEWILIYYWKLQLRKAYSLGLYKTYQKKKENLTSLRGSIDINSILKKEYFDGKTVCMYKEHSYNNELNAVIDMALTKVFKSKYQAIVSDIYNIKNAFSSLSCSDVNLRSVKNSRVLNPYFKKYNEVFDLSLKILGDMFAKVGKSQSEFSAFLFDISLLFEHHIRKTLKDKGFTLFPKNKKEFCIPNGIYENNIYPDVIIDYGNNNIGVYDVKYKNFDFAKGVNREDKFQLITYVATHLRKYNVIECGIIYPLRENNTNNKHRFQEQFLSIIKTDIPFKVKFYKVCENIENQLEADKEFFVENKKKEMQNKQLLEQRLKEEQMYGLYESLI